MTKAFDGNTPGEIAAREGGETVTLTIDGQQVTVPKGTNVIEAARQIGIEISAFCYHPGLSIAAVCRQCLVKIEKAPKLMPACQAIAADGMVVHATDEEAIEARKFMLEFTLVNHPIDCPICDKAGECLLQRHYVDHDAQLSRVDVPKIRKAKVVDTGPTIVLDQERCILCTRCIRVCDEVAGEHQLDMINRGNKETLTTAPGRELDNPYSLNTVDVCPVGALTSKDFRFAMRVWELYTTPSVCPGCATGCNIEIHHNEGRPYRLVPRENAAVNKHWMCDEGRMLYKPLREGRLAGPTLEGLPSSWDKAVAAAGAAIQQALAGDRSRVGVVFSAWHSNEANYALAKLARDYWQLERAYIAAAADRPEREDGILRVADVNPNRRGVTAIIGDEVGDAAALERDLLAGALDALIVLGHQAPLSDEALARAGNLDALIVLADSDLGLASRAHVALAIAAWAEVHGTITNKQGLVQRLRAAFPPPGQALPAWEAIVRLGRASGATMEYAHPKAIFRDMIEEVPALSDASWGTEAPIVQLRFAHSRG